MAYNETPYPLKGTTMFNRIKNLDPQTKAFLTATAIITAINVTAIVAFKILEHREALSTIEN